MLRALDLFCGAGGASAGLERAGFDVLGVDHETQREYPYDFFRGDAITFAAHTRLADFDLVWASPPCQAFTAYKRRPDHVKPAENLIGKTREILRSSGVPYIIENVAGASAELGGYSGQRSLFGEVHGKPIMLCGSMFGLDVRRHRLFECNYPVPQPACRHELQAPRFPAATNRTVRNTVEVGAFRIPLAMARAAMGIEWMSREALSQAIPPAYSEYLARMWLEQRPPESP